MPDTIADPGPGGQTSRGGRVRPVSRRPPFDPRRDLRAELHGPGSMSVCIDGEWRIGGGLVVTGSQPLVAFHECGSCGLFECNLAEDYAARVRRVGPYVLWLTVWGELHCFGVERYREVFGDVAGLEAPRDRDYDLLVDEVARAGAWTCPDGRTLSLDLDRAPDAPLARLGAWRGGPGVEAVLPPADAVELRSVAGAPSLWLDPARRAAYLPGAFVLPVWIAGPDVDALLAEALGPA